MRKMNAVIVAVLLIELALPTVQGEQAATVEKLLTGLTNPSGVAVRPGGPADRFEIFVADSGAGRILQVSSDEPKSSAAVITGFSLATFGGESMKAGPIALGFLDRNHFLVGASGDERRASLRLYELADGTPAVPADQRAQQVDLQSDAEPAVEPADHIYALARSRANDLVPDAIIFTATRNDRTGGLLKIAIRAGQLGKLENFSRGGTAENGFPVAIGVTPHGHVVVGDAGALDQPRDSRLIFYNPIDGSRVMELTTNLYDIVALAYSPRTGNLYAADVAWMSRSEGGIYRIDDASRPGAPACKAVKMANVASPSAMAFGPDGALYVTVFGAAGEAGSKNGSLLKLTGEL
jgi:hypothetical protein